MSAITISRKHGSRGADVAQQLARKFGWECVDRGFVNKVISEYGLIRLGELYDTPPKLRDLFDQDTQWTIEWMTKTIRTIAARHDAVIVGRGGFAALHGYQDVFHALVDAPEDIQVRRTMEDEGLGEEKAKARVQRDTRTKTRFVRRYYGQNWADEANYHLVVDTHALSIEEAAERIASSAREHFSSSAGPRIADAEVDDVLLETIEGQFARRR